MHSYLIDILDRVYYAVGCLSINFVYLGLLKLFLWQVEFTVEDPRHEIEVIFDRKYT